MGKALAKKPMLSYNLKNLAVSLVQKFHLDIKQKLGKISKGMLSMVTIITAMASKAPFTFLDEPVAGLDVIAREQFYQLLLDEYTETEKSAWELQA